MQFGQPQSYQNPTSHSAPRQFAGTQRIGHLARAKLSSQLDRAARTAIGLVEQRRKLVDSLHKNAAAVVPVERAA